jgi:hypothetical protein
VKRSSEATQHAVKAWSRLAPTRPFGTSEHGPPGGDRALAPSAVAARSREGERCVPESAPIAAKPSNLLVFGDSELMTSRRTCRNVVEQEAQRELRRWWQIPRATRGRPRTGEQSLEGGFRIDRCSRRNGVIAWQRQATVMPPPASIATRTSLRRTRANPENGRRRPSISPRQASKVTASAGMCAWWYVLSVERCRSLAVKSRR